MKKLLLLIVLLSSCKKDDQTKPNYPDPVEWVTHEGSIIFFVYQNGLPANHGMDLYIEGDKVANLKTYFSYGPYCGHIGCYTLTDTTSRWVNWSAVEVGTNKTQSGTALIKMDYCNQVIIN